jgi:hypothetical protein
MQAQALSPVPIDQSVPQQDVSLETHAHTHGHDSGRVGIRNAEPIVQPRKPFDELDGNTDHAQHTVGTTDGQALAKLDAVRSSTVEHTEKVNPVVPSSGDSRGRSYVLQSP